MRKIRYFLLSAVLTVSLAACGNADAETKREPSYHTEALTPERTASEEEASDEKERSEKEEGKKILVAYFSWADNAEQANIDAVSSASVAAPGNVAQFAAWIAEETGGELFPIRVAEPYSADWNECLNRANREKADDARPELVQNIENMEAYGVVFLGYAGGIIGLN